jgi:MFS transporter, DHA1 family, inner membrane transport protein
VRMADPAPLSAPAPADRPLAVGAAVALSFIAMASFLIQPQFSVALVADLHFSEREVGNLAAIGAAGTVLSAIAATFWVRRVSWRLAAYIALAGLVLVNSVLMLSHERLPFFAAATLGGFFGGSLYSLALTVLSDGTHPDRYFGYSVATQVAFQVAGLLAGPWLQAQAGVNGLIALFLALDAAGLLAVWILPVQGQRTGSAVLGAGCLVTRATMLALCGCFLFFFNVGCYWTYVELMGTAAGIAPQQVANLLAFGVAIGIGGALLASWMGERHGRIPAIAASAVASVLAALLLVGKVSPAAYEVSAVVYNFAWNLSLTYQYGAVNAADRTGRGVAAAPAFHAAGASAGPALAAVLVRPDDHRSVVWLVCTSVLLSLACFVLATLRPAAAPSAAHTVRP